MINFNISAPGRIVLNGEHSMMYGKNVVMASIDRRTRLKFCELPDEPEKMIKIEFPDVDLSLNIPLEKVLSFFSNGNFVNVVSSPIRLFSYVKYLIISNGMWSIFEQRFSLEIFFFLLYFIAHHEQLEMKSFYVHVFTELPIGAGLGSSSSFAVCLAACFLRWTRLQRGAHNAFNEEELMEILRYTTCCEEIMQDYMFAVDNIVCLYGQTGKFQYINPLSYCISTINIARMKILLIDSNIRQNKSERAKQMAKLKHSHPNYADFVLNSFDMISEEMYKMLSDINYTRGNPDLLRSQEHLYDILQIYILISQEIVQNFSLSHPRFDTICSIAYDFGFAGKLTGFGGGFVYVLLPPSITEEGITSLSTHLMGEGFKVTLTSVSCSGVRIDD